MPHRRGFIGSLFDLSFRSLIGVRVVAVLYAVALLLGAVVIFGTAAVGACPGLFKAMGFVIDPPPAGVRMLVVLLSPVAYLVYVIYARFHFEMMVVLFCIAENTAGMADRAGVASVRRGLPGGRKRRMQ